MMSPPVPIALLGFTPFERQHLEPGLSAVRRLKPAYTPRRHLPASCNLLVVNADNEQACQLVLQQKRLPCTLMIGNTHHAGAAAHLPRPIQIGAVLETLDELLAQAPPMSAEVAKVHATLAALLESRQMEASTPDQAQPVAAAAPAPASAARRGSALLVAGESAATTRLQRTLLDAGLDIQRVAGGSQALAWLHNSTVDYVFLATGEPGADSAADSDGFHTCKLLLRLPPAKPVAPPPTLVLLLGSDMMIDRLRAERAGADAWLTPAWESADVLRVIDERERWLASLPRREF